MRPFQLAAHSRPVTQTKYNTEGDLLFSTSKDKKAMVWFTKNGERLGEYVGHQGAVDACDVRWDTKRLVTGDADSSVCYWDVETGAMLTTKKFTSPVRCVKFCIGGTRVAVVQDARLNGTPTIWVFPCNDQTINWEAPILQITDFKTQASCVEWGPLNKTLISGHQNGEVIHWDAELGTRIREDHSHTGRVNKMAMAKDGSVVLTASLDETVRMFDTTSLKLMKTYDSGRPVNDCAINTNIEHVMLAGGQDAAMVTTTSNSAGKFDAVFFSMVHEHQVGSIDGHFGPINAVDFSPSDGGFVTGGEDGFMRLYHFDEGYIAECMEALEIPTF